MLEWLSSPLVWWFLLACALAALELFLLTVALFFFALGALAAAFMAWLDLSFTWQLSAFIIVSISSLVSLRRRLKVWLNRSDRHVANNDLVGKAVKVLSPIISEQSGLVELNGAQWRAELAPHSPPLAEGQPAIVQSFEGLTLRVAARDKPEAAEPLGTRG